MSKFDIDIDSTSRNSSGLFIIHSSSLCIDIPSYSTIVNLTYTGDLGRACKMMDESLVSTSLVSPTNR